MPPLLQWLPRYAAPSVLSVGATYGMLWLTQRRALRQPIRADVAVAQSAGGAAWGSGVLLAVVCNLMNNLPAGLIAGGAVQAAQAPAGVVGAVLIGVDLGPNLSVTGSLATILWLGALRREGHAIGAGTFLRLGLLVMPPALLLALAALTLGPG
jgi:Na+/H+ antiporter NhaD/arsenite permease-like protein